MWLPLWPLFTSNCKATSSGSVVKQGLWPAALLGAAMVARGEIGLLIVQIGYNQTSYVSDAGLNIAIWAVLLNTIIGPIFVGLLIKLKGESLGRGPWGTQSPSEEERAR